jgi:DNA-directed RNA polymerase subunit alpha
MIPLPSKPKIIEKKENKALFEIEGLYPGYGVTLGNSLRRVLYSSLEGAAVTQIKIKGVQHEFSTIEGILEDVTTIILNIKNLRFKMHSDEPQKALLKVKGEKKVKSSDITLPTQMELISQDVHLATLTDKKSELEIEFQVEKGFGYLSVAEEKSEKLEVGQISVDAVFTPIRNVNFRVENMRVGKRTDFDRLFIEVETDGTIDPEEALSESAEILVNHFSQLIVAKKEAGISDLKIGSRTMNILNKNNIKTINDLAQKTEESLMELEGMGEKGINEIKKALKKAGIEKDA